MNEALISCGFRKWHVTRKWAEGGTGSRDVGVDLLTAEGYVPLTEQQRYSTGRIMPALTGQVTIEVPPSGTVTVPELELGFPLAGGE